MLVLLPCAAAVGYGDLYPQTIPGKLFTSAFCLFGLTVVLAALAPIVAFLHGDWRETIMKAFGASSQVSAQSLARAMRSNPSCSDSSFPHACTFRRWMCRTQS